MTGKNQRGFSKDKSCLTDVVASYDWLKELASVVYSPTGGLALEAVLRDPYWTDAIYCIYYGQEVTLGKFADTNWGEW